SKLELGSSRIRSKLELDLKSLNIIPKSMFFKVDLANRLAPVIADLISDTQSAFVAGKTNFRCPVILEEIHHNARGGNEEQLLAEFDFFDGFGDLIEFSDRSDGGGFYPHDWSFGVSKSGSPWILSDSYSTRGQSYVGGSVLRNLGGLSGYFRNRIIFEESPPRRVGNF
ncbi:hypothetical protein Tco_1036743, partial [Tanacetum coccineum]